MPENPRLSRVREFLILTLRNGRREPAHKQMFSGETLGQIFGLRAFAVWYALCWPVPATLITLLAMPWRRSLWVVGACGWDGQELESEASWLFAEAHFSSLLCLFVATRWKMVSQYGFLVNKT